MLELLFAAIVALAHADMAADKANINADCKNDAIAAGCKDATMGNGLAKCLFTYHQKNPRHKLAPKCKADILKFSKDRADERKKANAH